MELNEVWSILDTKGTLRLMIALTVVAWLCLCLLLQPHVIRNSDMLPVIIESNIGELSVQRSTENSLTVWFNDGYGIDVRLLVLELP